MLNLTRLAGESLILTAADQRHLATILIANLDNHRASVKIYAPRDVQILRAELMHRPGNTPTYQCRNCHAITTLTNTIGPAEPCSQCGAYDWTRYGYPR